jgi:hypothetical protein
VIPVALATAALVGRAATADRTVGIVGHVRGDRAIGPAVTGGCSPGTALGARDGGIIRTAKVAGDGGMIRTGCYMAVGAGGGTNIYASVRCLRRVHVAQVAFACLDRRITLSLDCRIAFALDCRIASVCLAKDHAAGNGQECRVRNIMTSPTERSPNWTSRQFEA